MDGPGVVLILQEDLDEKSKSAQMAARGRGGRETYAVPAESEDDPGEAGRADGGEVEGCPELSGRRKGWSRSGLDGRQELE